MVLSKMVKALGVLLLAAPFAPAQAQSVPGCGNLANPYGPFDYRTQKDKLVVVEKFHFTPEVERLVQGESGSVQGDLSYTLRASPNHSRALLAFDRWETMKLKEDPFYRPDRNVFSAECYFKRALAFAPDDAIATLLFGVHYARRDDNDRAEELYLRSIALNPDIMDAYYNLGLLYVKEERYEEAKQYAEKAYAMGHPLPGLKNKLAAAGHWE